jgi:hypothetical protein
MTRVPPMNVDDAISESIKNHASTDSLIALVS